MTKEEAQAELIEALKAYINLLGTEYDELALQATNRGWVSKRKAAGMLTRRKITDAENQLNQPTND